jgi:hypothetical protein
LDKRYNLFLSHASEDKVFTNPLADKLKSLGLEVWYDDYVLKIGQQLRVTLGNGLKNLILCSCIKNFLPRLGRN